MNYQIINEEGTPIGTLTLIRVDPAFPVVVERVDERSVRLLTLTLSEPAPEILEMGSPDSQVLQSLRQYFGIEGDWDVIEWMKARLTPAGNPRKRSST